MKGITNAKSEEKDIPTKTSDLTNDSGFITSNSVGNGTITINQGGTQKGTFTVNQSGNTTINLDAGGASTPVVDNLTSTSTTSALSANQGRVLDTNKANLTGGNIFSGNQQFNDLVYLEGATPFFLSKQGKIGMRATNSSNENLGQVNISNAWYDSQHYGAQMSAKNVATGKYNAIRVSHNGAQYFDENDIAHNLALEEEIPTKTSDLTNDSGFITASDASTTATANKLVMRDGNGHIYGNYIEGTWGYFSASAASEQANYSGIAVYNGNWLYKRSLANLKSDLGVPTKTSDLTNDEFVRYDTASQGLSDTQKSNARTNIGAGTSNFSGDYNDLSNKPTIPTIPTHKTLNTSNTTAQTTSSSESLTGSGSINLHKVSKTGNYNDLLNKPTIPTVGNGTITINQGGTQKGTFTTNQSGNTTINLDAGGGSPLDAYPVGSIYMSVNSTSPASLFGGSWERIKDKFLLGAGDTYSAGTTGGAATHTLTVNEMPSHYHNYYAASYSDTESLGKNYGYNNSNFKANGIFCTNYTTYGKGYGGKQMIDNTGGGQAHNNMPPYIAVYIWKRTA